MRIRISATWLSLLLVVVALGRPTAPARSAPSGRPAQEVGSVPFDADLWSPAHPTAGGIVLLVNPADAEIYVDGGYAGRPLHFSPARPLRLGAGQHRIELIATGYSTARLDVAVLPGFVSTVEVVLDKW
jgi:hypothetical protein